MTEDQNFGFAPLISTQTAVGIVSRSSYVGAGPAGPVTGCLLRYAGLSKCANRVQSKVRVPHDSHAARRS